MSDLILVKFCQHIPRMGDIEALFITNQQNFDAALGKRIDLGSALGKHSNIIVTMTRENTHTASTDQALIGMMEALDVLPIGWDLAYMALEQEAERAGLP